MMATDPIETFTTEALEAGEQRAWREAVRSWADVRAHCQRHGSGGHTQACVMLGEDARNADAHWSRFKAELNRRKDFRR